MKKCRHIKYFDYLVSEFGDFYSLKQNRYLKGGTRSGYQRFCISIEGKNRHVSAHIVVAELYLGGKPTDCHEVNHIDGVRNNNHFSNLEWVTRSENIKHAYDNLIAYRRVGELNPSTKLTDKDREEIYRRRYDLNHTPKNLADEFQVHVETIYRACNYVRRRL